MVPLNSRNFASCSVNLCNSIEVHFWLTDERRGGGGGGGGGGLEEER